MAEFAEDAEPRHHSGKGRSAAPPVERCALRDAVSSLSMRTTLLFASCFTTILLAAAPTSQETIDKSMIDKIIREGSERSRVAATFGHFVDVIGPRLTATPAYKAAADWSRSRLAEWGLKDARLESWEFGRGWQLDQFTLEMIEPRYMPLIGYPEGWSASTPGPVTGTPVLVGGKTPEELQAMRQTLKGAILLTQPEQTSYVRQDRGQPTDPAYTPPPPPPAGARGPRQRRGRRRTRRDAAAASRRRPRCLAENEPRGTRHDVRARARSGCRRAALDYRGRRALQHAGAHGRRRCAGEAPRQRAHAVPRSRPQRLQRAGGAAGRASDIERSGRDDRCAPRFVAQRAGRHRQRRRRGGRARGDAHSRRGRRQAQPDDPRRALGRRGAGAARLARATSAGTSRAMRMPPTASAFRSTSTWIPERARSTAGFSRDRQTPPH